MLLVNKDVYDNKDINDDGFRT